MSNAAAQSKPFIRPATLADIQELAATMREEDKEEIFLSSRSAPLDALTVGFTSSDSTSTIVWEGRVMAVFGIAGVKGRGGCPWMLGAPGIERCRSLLRECRVVLSGYLKDYGYLTNACWSKNTVHIKWIEWLGFNFSGSDTRNGELFLYFHKGSHV